MQYENYRILGIASRLDQGDRIGQSPLPHCKAKAIADCAARAAERLDLGKSLWGGVLVRYTRTIIRNGFNRTDPSGSGVFVFHGGTPLRFLSTPPGIGDKLKLKFKNTIPLERIVGELSLSAFIRRAFSFLLI